MLNFALLLLALAAGIYLLIKANSLFLSKIYSALILLEIGLSLAGIVALGYKGVQHLSHRGCDNKQECRVEKKVIIQDGKEEMYETSTRGCSMHGCKLEGDSVVMEKEVCEKMMGKEVCDAMSKERGRCIISKDECMKMCHAEGKPCGGEKPAAGCTPKCAGEKKECCKKAM